MTIDLHHSESMIATKSIDSPLGVANFLVVTFDSCRWDTFVAARTPFLDHRGLARQAYTHGTFTFAAHMAIYEGILPQMRERVPFYNRYAGQLIRISRRPTMVPNLVRFDDGCLNIIEGFTRAGYRTFGTGAVGWFKHPQLTEPFQEFLFTGIHGVRQVDRFISWTKYNNRPFFGLINFGETHDPYEFGPERISYPQVSRPRQLEGLATSVDQEAWTKQVRCCEFLDGLMGILIDHLEDLDRPTIVVVCGDHGECFGEDGCVGHGFYHPKVMEVPLAIFEINGNYLMAAGQIHKSGEHVLDAH